MLYTYFLGVLLVVGSGYALYDSNSDVVELTPDNFNRLVTDSYEVWLVEFYAPWCGHCKNLAPEYKKTAKALRGIVKVGAVDADKYKGFGKNYGVTGFPTIKIFTGSKHIPYKGARTADGLVDAALKSVKSKAYERLGKRPEDSGPDKMTTPDTFGHNIPWKNPIRNASETSQPPLIYQQNGILETCAPDSKTDENQQYTEKVIQQYSTTIMIARMKKALKTTLIKNTMTTKAPTNSTSSVSSTPMTMYDRFKMLQTQLFRGNIKDAQKARIIKVLMKLKFMLQHKGVVYKNASVIKRRAAKRQGLRSKMMKTKKL